MPSAQCTGSIPRLPLALALLPPEVGAHPIPRGPSESPQHPPGLCGRAGLSRCLLPRPTGIVCLVVTIMYWSGWEMGAVEAISLSILVGSSVDYCVHLVEGYLLAGENLPPHQAEVSSPPALQLPVRLPPRCSGGTPSCLSPTRVCSRSCGSQGPSPRGRELPGSSPSQPSASLSGREGLDQAASKGRSCLSAPQSVSRPAAGGAGLGPRS